MPIREREEKHPGGGRGGGGRGGRERERERRPFLILAVTLRVLASDSVSWRDCRSAVASRRPHARPPRRAGPPAAAAQARVRVSRCGGQVGVSAFSLYTGGGLRYPHIEHEVGLEFLRRCRSTATSRLATRFLLRQRSVTDCRRRHSRRDTERAANASLGVLELLNLLFEHITARAMRVCLVVHAHAVGDRPKVACRRCAAHERGVARWSRLRPSQMSRGAVPELPPRAGRLPTSPRARRG